MAETSMPRVQHKFYRHVTSDDQLQAYVFTYTNALVQAENSMYIIFHESAKRKFRYNPDIRQYLVKVEECDCTTRYLLCQDVIFHQMKDQTNYLMQGRNEQMLDKQISTL